MHTFRVSVLALLLLALASVTASAQMISGTTLYFDHAAADQAFVDSYVLCVDGSGLCTAVGVTRIGTSEVLTFTLPAWAPKGKHDFTIVAVWKAPLVGRSAPTNIYTDTVVGGPGRLRSTQAPE
jgi:hypothetical protein